MPLPFFTVGHSNRTIEEFTAILRSADIQLVVDVRKLAGSNRYPQFNADSLDHSLSDTGVRFARIAELSGRRLVSKDVPFEVNAFWQNRSFHNYADHALSEEFRRGIDELSERGRDLRTAVMCSEAVWWRCHRRLIADHLIAHGEQVIHLMGENRQHPAELTPGGVIRDDARVIYPPERAH